KRLLASEPEDDEQTLDATADGELPELDFAHLRRAGDQDRRHELGRRHVVEGDVERAARRFERSKRRLRECWLHREATSTRLCDRRCACLVGLLRSSVPLPPVEL